MQGVAISEQKNKCFSYVYTYKFGCEFEMCILKLMRTWQIEVSTVEGRHYNKTYTFNWPTLPLKICDHFQTTQILTSFWVIFKELNVRWMKNHRPQNSKFCVKVWCTEALWCEMVFLAWLASDDTQIQSWVLNVLGHWK